MKSSFSNPEGNCWHVERVDDDLVMIWSDVDLWPARVGDTVEATRALFDGIKAGEFDHLVQPAEPARVGQYAVGNSGIH